MGSVMSGYDKPSKYGGRVWIEKEPASMFGSEYVLRVNGNIEAQSNDWEHIVSRFNEFTV